MYCPFCQVENDARNRFCGGCGRSLIGATDPGRIAERKKRLGFCVGLAAGVLITCSIFRGSRSIPVRVVAAPATVSVTAPAQTHHLRGKVLAFTDDSVSTQDQETVADDEASGFAQYLQSAGSEPQTRLLNVKVEPGYFKADGKEWYAHWYSDEWLTRYDIEYLAEPDCLDKEYAHLVFQGSQPRMFTNDQPDGTWALEDALARYLPCSYHDHSLFAQEGVKSIADCDSIEFDDADAAYRLNQDQEDTNLFWGALFWELRQTLGQDPQGAWRIDRILIASWKSLPVSKIQGGERSLYTAFAQAMLAQDRAIYGGEHQADIRAALERRGLHGVK